MRARPVELLSLLALGGFAAGCVTVGPDYRRPAFPTPEAYRSAAAGETPELDGWWRTFGDPELDRLVEVALAENADIRIAVARVDEAQAIAGAYLAQRMPELEARIPVSRTRVSTATTPLPPGVSAESERYRVSVAVLWGLDPWGRLRRLYEAGVADLVATRYGAAAVRSSLVANVATTYFSLRALDRQLAIARETLASRREALDLQKLRFDAGVISELELAQAEAELAATQATLPALELEAASAESRLSLLLGRHPAALPRGRELEALALPPEVPAGLPSSLLERRPDVASAEQRLVAANARIGLAKAAYFPLIPLTGYLGTESLELAGLFGSGSNIWQIATSIVAPLFNAGRIGREVDAARARQVQALETYRQALQTAFADVETALLARRVHAQRHAALADQLAALERAEHLAQLRYDAGSSSYLEVLDAQRLRFRAQLDLANARRDELDAAVAVYAALGGGWSTAEAEASAAP